MGNKKAPKENVLLLAMSTLPRYRKEYTYIMNDSGEQYRYKAELQLVPGTEYIIEKLARQSEKLNRIVIMSTKETRGHLTDRDYIDTWGSDESAETRFKKEIRSFISEKINGNGRYDVNYSDEDLEWFFLPVPIDRENTAFWGVMKEIKGLAADGRIDLYVNIQGGNRNVTVQMDAVMQLLRHQHVSVKERVSVVNFDYKKDEQMMTEVSDQFELYNLVNAMQAFVLYGSGSELAEYIENYTRKDNNYEKYHDIVDAITKASDAISLCNVVLFDEAVLDISKALTNHPPVDNNLMTPMDIVVGYIGDDYKKLIDCQNSPKRYIDQIRWCIDKGFIQQALTICETKMPDVMVNTGIIYYDAKIAAEEFNRIEKLDKLSADAKVADEYKYKNPNHYFVKYYIKKKNANKSIIHTRETDKPQRVQVIIDRYNTLCKKRNDINHAYDISRSNSGVKDNKVNLLANLDNLINLAEKCINEYDRTGRFTISKQLIYDSANHKFKAGKSKK